MTVEDKFNRFPPPRRKQTDFTLAAQKIGGEFATTEGLRSWQSDLHADNFIFELKDPSRSRRAVRAIR